MSECPDPKCDIDILFTAHENERNGRWTVLPLESAPDNGDFRVLMKTHPAVDIMGQPAGAYHISEYMGPGLGEGYRTHSSSHFLGNH